MGRIKFSFFRKSVKSMSLFYKEKAVAMLRRSIITFLVRNQ